MITHKIIYDNNTGNIKQFQEYKDNVLSFEEIYNEDNILIQINHPNDKTLKLFYDNEYWYVFKKRNYAITMKEVFGVPMLLNDENDNNIFSYTIAKYNKINTPENPLIGNTISLANRIQIFEEECTQLRTPIDNDSAITIIKKLFVKYNLKRNGLFEGVLESLNKINNKDWESNEDI